MEKIGLLRRWVLKFLEVRGDDFRNLLSKGLADQSINNNKIHPPMFTNRANSEMARQFNLNNVCVGVHDPILST